MHPLLTHLRALAAYALAWLLAGTALAAAWVLAWAQPWPWALALALPVALLGGLGALLMYPVCRSQPLRPAKWISASARRGAAALLLAVLVAGAASLWNASGLLLGRAGLVELPPLAWLVLIAGLAVLFLISALTHDAVLAQQALQAAAATEARARLQARELELRVLRNQIDPHFLFNALNSISALTLLDAGAARAMTIDLAQFFRLTLALGARARIRLDAELELVQHYAAIERRRLGEKLRLAIDADAACRGAQLPPLLLQPLVENAIKHGIRLLDAGGCVDIHARRADQRLLLTVSNPVPVDAAPDTSGLGQGLPHLRARLAALYPEPTFVDVRRSAGRCSVDISLPWSP